MTTKWRGILRKGDLSRVTKRGRLASADWLHRQVESARLQKVSTGHATRPCLQILTPTTQHNGHKAKHAARQVHRYTVDVTGSVVSLVEIANALDVI
jgi:hypothetical protein